MTTDWPTVLVRFALYLDLMPVFGLPFFAWHALRGDALRSGVAASALHVAAAGAAVGLLLSLAQLGLMARALSGFGHDPPLDGETLGLLITGTDFGLAWCVRMAALLAVVLAVPLRRRAGQRCLGIVTGAAAVALSTLAWAGHGAMDEGARRYLHLGADIAHLLAAGTWVGALLAFVWMTVRARRAAPEHLAMLSRTTRGFAGVGTLVVATLVLTGAINYWLILGPSLAGIVSSAYGVLLMAKLALFCAMLALAAMNRYRFSPRLAAGLASGDSPPAARALRRSLCAEAGFAVAILALVAWLGTLPPQPQ